MQTQIESPPRGPEGPPAPTRSRRPLRRWLWVSAAVLIALILGSLIVFLTNYDPICHADCSGVSGVHGPSVKELGAFISPQGDDFNAYRVALKPGGGFSFWLTLSNDGPLAVTITGIGSTSQFSPYLQIARVQTAPETGNPPLEAFREFSLAPRDRQFIDVLVTVQMRRCLPGPAEYQIGSVPVTYKIFGFTRQTTVFLRSSIAVTSQPGSTCH
jgi:hypothetical protein